MKKILYITGGVILFLAIAASGFITYLQRRALPDYDRNIRLEGLTGEVSVLRDSFAIPHVFAENEHDLYLAVGYAMAQDRLWQMDLLRRVTQGRLAEIFGKDLIDADLLFRSLRFTEKSQKVLSAAAPELKDALDAFASGVNQFIGNAGRNLPPEFALLGYRPEPWKPEQSLNLIGYMAWDLSTGWPCEVLYDKILEKLGPDLASYMFPDMNAVHVTPIFPGFSLAGQSGVSFNGLRDAVSFVDELGLDVFRGSNNWAVSGSRTSTGKPLLANDMHLGLNVPGIWYQMHQSVPGKLNVTGVVLPGQPMVVAGHNDSIAWGFTNVMTDDADFYVETVNPSNPDEYRLDGSWRKMEVRQERILVKGGDTVMKVNRFTHRGPVVSEQQGVTDKVISMRWLGNEASDEVSAVYKLNRASNWKEFRDALRGFVAVNQNAVYADVQGNIGLQSTIGIPIREGNRSLVYPGDTSRYDWRGLVPFDELPNTFNPESGFVASANCKTAPPDYPYHISDWYVLPYRMDRINELLSKGDRFSVEDFKRIQTDQQSKMAEKFCRYFLSRVVLQGGLSELEKTVYDRMRGWDFIGLKEGPEAMVFEYWYYNTGVNLVKDQMDSLMLQDFIGEKTFFQNLLENMLVNPSARWADDVSTAGVEESFGDIISLSFRQTVGELADRWGTDPGKWQWGDVHILQLAHPMSSVALIRKIFALNPEGHPVGGSYHTVAPYSFPLTNFTKVNHGASERHIFNTADWNGSLTVIPTGTSGIPASPHYCDQTADYASGRYHSDYVTREKVEAAAKYRMKFTR